MKLTRDREGELMLVYETWWHSYLNGDINTYDSFLADDFHFVGSTNGEEYLNKKDTTAFFDATAHQLAGKAELRNLKRTIEELDGGLVVITDLADAYVISEPEWVFYSRFRFTSMMKETLNGWRFIYQHFSAPDTKAQEGETLGTEQITKENQELRDAIKRRTAELENKSRELEIEAALERVRNRTLLMKDSNELNEAAAVFFQQLKTLSLLPAEARTYFCHINPETAVAEVWMTHANGSVMQGSHQTPLNNSPSIVNYFEAWKRKEPINVRSYTGDSLNEYLQFISSLPHVKVDKDYQQLLGSPPEKIVMTDANFLQGNVGVMTFEPLSLEALDIMARFAKVFEFTYSRFLDLQKAEAHAREAQIEAALERVRSRSMAMHKSDELADAAQLLYREFRTLNISTLSCGYSFINEATNTQTVWTVLPDGTLVSDFIVFPLTGDQVLDDRYQDWKEKKELHTYEIKGEANKEHHQFLSQYVPVYVVEEIFAKLPDRIVFHCANFSDGYLFILATEFLNKEDQQTIIRFAKVFQQTYTRFLDLQKAEAQAREAQIEVAVERVRAKALAMHKSEDLHNAVVTLKKELMRLRIPDITAATIYLEQNDGSIRVLDLSDTAEEDDDKPQLKLDKVFRLEDTDPDLWIRRMWNRSERYFVLEADKNDFVRVVQWIKTFDPAGAEMAEKIIREKAIKKAWLPTVKLEKGVMNIDLLAPPVPEIENILLKMGAGFDLAYKRFLDLQNAEAQTREAKMEAALEKARARTMGMQSSDELPEVANVLFLEVQGLGIPAWSCGYNILAEDKTSATCCMSSEGTLQTPFKLRLWGEASFDEMGDFLRSEDTMLVQELGDTAIEEHYTYMKSFPDLKPTFDQIDELGLSLPTYQINHLCKFTQGFLLFITYEKVPESHDIFKRFTRVFEQTYTRFLDLQKAEEQAREAKIEAALEKVRSRSLAMHRPEELKEVVAVVVEKLQQLGVVLDANGVIICTYFQDSKNVLHWIASPDYSFVGSYLLPYFDHPIFNAAWESKLSGDDYFSKAFSVEEKNSFFEYAFEHSDYRHFPDDFKQWIFQNDQHILSFAWQKNSAILIPSHTGVVPSADDIAILKRFANVFEQAYTRFLDLQKAEEQTREAQINLAVERVRARALAMFKSEEILQVVNKLKEEIMGLEIPNVIAATIHLKENDGRCRIWDISSIEINDEALHHPMDIRFKLEDTDPNFFMRRIWGNTANYFVEMQDEDDLRRTIQWLRDNDRNQQADETGQFIETTKMKKLYHPTVQLNSGRMCIDLLDAPAPEIASILEKMGAAFDLAYTRFEDLKKSEAQLREAQVEAALERVRSRTMAMQDSGEMAETASVLFQQIKELGFETWSCGFCIWQKDDFVEAWMGADSGGLLPPMRIPYKKEKTHSEIYASYLNGDPSHEKVWEGEDLVTHYQYMQSIPSIKKAFEVLRESGLTPPTRQCYNIGFFEYGYLMLITLEPKAELKDLSVRFAKVFEQTYTRFLDLKKAEAQALRAEQDLFEIKIARKKAEEALSELQVTQKQLIQSEKMASLGELTAGIAHEIQNPLNFVNNFSEVSKEMLDEMREAIEKGDTEEAKEIMNDVIQNLEKINHHGKRADGIVKGMLQHSRSSTGQKEPTNVNLLADEYLRLAYHGLRAKDKFFNATLKTDYDDSIGHINIIPQDIGRVILNLITNAFYAVNEKNLSAILNPAYLQAGPTSVKYDPTVSISTKRNGDKVQLSVKDNGNGIPQNVLNKIFQPFFTTKPTGQGTGLGLSLSYDIVKAHGGEMKVETKEGEGAEFIIQLPNK